MKTLKGRPDYFEALNPGQKHHGIRYAMLNLAASCALQCTKCARVDARDQLRHEATPPLTFAEQTKFLEIAKQIGAQEMVIIGEGEPTQVNNWQKLYQPIIEAAYEKGMGTILFTTAFFLTKEQAEFCRNHDVTIIVSLDTLNNATYSDIYGLDQWSKGSVQERAAQALVKKPADHIRQKIAMLEKAYAASSEQLTDGTTVTRLGINTTIQLKNENELDGLRDFAHEHGMYYVANYLMPEGRATRYENWSELVGSDENWERHQRLSAAKSDSHGHSSMVDGVCNYFSDGIACDSRGYLLTCGYASATANEAENIRNITTPEKLLWIQQRNQRAYRAWAETIHHQPSCPLRDCSYGNFVAWLDRERLTGR